MTMDYRENAGYIITDSLHVGDREFVLGVHKTARSQFVTWRCANQTEFYWGHYFDDLFSAQKDLVSRVQAELQCLEELGQHSVTFRQPAYSPWGEIQHCETLCPGAYSVSTAGHGGVMGHRELVDKALRREAQDCGFLSGSYLCFEEDCDGPVALRELMDRKLCQAPVNEYFAPGEYEAVIDRSLPSYHPAHSPARDKAVAGPAIKVQG